jgi:dipeptidyl aminopeptidase/acylaminoacyl peptidase
MEIDDSVRLVGAVKRIFYGCRLTRMVQRMEKRYLRIFAGVVTSLGLMAGVCLGQGAAEQKKRPMTFADLMAMKRVSDPQISPSGKWVMFCVTDVSLEKNTKTNHLWVVPIAGGKEVQITLGEGESNGRFSPDGKSVSYTAGDQVVLAAWDEGAGKVGEGHALTHVSTGADGAIWSPDSQRLLFVSSVYPECSDKAMWAEEDACNKAKDETTEKSQVRAQVWDELLFRHWNNYTGQKRSHVLMVSAADGSHVRDLTPKSTVGTAETPTFSLGGPLGYAWAPDSKEVAYVTNLDKVPAASTNNDVFTLRVDEPAAKAVKISTSPGSDDGPAYSPDGKYIAFRSQERNGFESDQFRLVLFDRGKRILRTAAPQVELPRGGLYDNWIDEFVWAPDSDSIVFASGVRGMEALFSYTILPDQKPTEKSLFVRLTREGEYSDIHITRTGAGATIIASKMTLTSPAMAVAIKAEALGHTYYDAASPDVTEIPLEEKSLVHLNEPLLEQLSLSKLEPFWFKGAEGTEVEGFLVKPPNFDPNKKYPLKFLMHGGPQTAWGDSWSYRWNWQLMAASGYVVVGINRRGSTGYGQKFVDEVSGDWGGRAYEDLMKGLDYAEQHYSFIDKDRECALGASYGGFMADWVLTHTNRFKCIVTHDGMYDPVSAYGTTEEMWFNEWEFRRPEDFPAGWDGFTTAKAGPPPAAKDDKPKSEGQPSQPWRYQNLTAEQDPFRKWSPMLHIKDAKTPTLVIHSQRDYRLDVSQGFELYTALQRLGVPSKFLYFPDEGHWVLKPQNSQLWNATVEDWCDRWTKSGKYAAQ